MSFFQFYVGTNGSYSEAAFLATTTAHNELRILCYNGSSSSDSDPVHLDFKVCAPLQKLAVQCIAFPNEIMPYHIIVDCRWKINISETPSICIENYSNAKFSLSDKWHGRFFDLKMIDYNCDGGICQSHPICLGNSKEAAECFNFAPLALTKNTLTIKINTTIMTNNTKEIIEQNEHDVKFNLSSIYQSNLAPSINNCETDRCELHVNVPYVIYLLFSAHFPSLTIENLLKFEMKATDVKFNRTFEPTVFFTNSTINRFLGVISITFTAVNLSPDTTYQFEMKYKLLPSLYFSKIFKVDIKTNLSESMLAEENFITNYYFIGIIIIVVVMVVGCAVIIYKFYRCKNLGGQIIEAPETNNHVENIPFEYAYRNVIHPYQRPFRNIRPEFKGLYRIARQRVLLRKFLGQGISAEVHEGILFTFGHPTSRIAVKKPHNDASEHSVMDFYWEALTLSRFNSPHIVKLIGVCFDKMPMLIVTELLDGGDLISFLEENRPQDAPTSNIRVRDLVRIALDIAKGCKYLEDKHFIHCDIAARNCLLTSRGNGREAKIADFGMARDIYRRCYYRKDGSCLLPVRWMAPEAICYFKFTSKTDVWSFGILLWEIFTMGYIPYPGKNNNQVMEFIMNNGRLSSPPGCPTQIGHIMSQCWNSNANQRPNFSAISESLDYYISNFDCDIMVVFKMINPMDN